MPEEEKKQPERKTRQDRLKDKEPRPKEKTENAPKEEKPDFREAKTPDPLMNPHRKDEKKKAVPDVPLRTLGNYFALGLARLYSFLLIFVGLCLDGSKNSLRGQDNLFYLLATSLGRRERVPGVTGRVILALVACYISLLTFALGYEYRFFKRKNKKPFSVLPLAVYFLSVFLCLFLSIGIGILFQSPRTKENIIPLLTFIGNSLAVSLLVYCFLALLIGAILLSVIALFKLVTKKKVAEPIDDEVKDNDVSSDRKKLPSDKEEGKDAAKEGSLASALGGVGGVGSIEDAPVKDRERVFPGLSRIDKRYSGVKKHDSHVVPHLTLSDLVVQFRNYLAKEEKLYYSLNDLRTFVSGRCVSHFSILQGRSGTGKSSLPRYFCKFIGGEVVFLPVQATWRDKSSLLGYFNDFSKTYNETDCLLKLYEANYNPDKIYRFVLDERNISRVEYYFADFLSTLEYPSDQWKIRVYQLPYGFNPPLRLAEGKIKISKNAYFVGTANQDESTFAIADKVYDRSVTMDFNGRNDPFAVEEEMKTLPLTNTQLTSLLADAVKNPDYRLSSEDRKKFDSVANYIADSFSVAYGNRILNQRENFVPAFVGCGGKKEDALDYVLSEKIVRKLQGRFEDYVRPSLEEVDQMLTNLYGSKEFPLTRRRIKERIKKL